ncbi:MAG: transcription-repair coupling factor [Alloprevotella sp.]
MELSAILPRFARHPGVAALAKMTTEGAPRRIFCDGLRASATAVVTAALQTRLASRCTLPLLCILNDEEAAGYFYHDLVQLLGDTDVLFFPSTFRRAVKYAQRDAANEILRTAVLSRLQGLKGDTARPKACIVVTFPAALAEKVPSKADYDAQTLRLAIGSSHDLTLLAGQLNALGFRRRDYVYEPGEYAVRGSILDIYSFASELPVRLDFFGDDIETIRTFTVEDQLSKDRLEEAVIVPEVERQTEELVPFADFLPQETVVVCTDADFVVDSVQRIYDEGFARQAVAEREATSEAEAAAITQQLRRETLLIDGAALRRRLTPLQWVETGAKRPAAAEAVVLFHTEPQPLFHKNFQLLGQLLTQCLVDKTEAYICADSTKQTDRLKAILDESSGQENPPVLFHPLQRTLHEGFTDNDLHIAVFTDHQVFERYHKYNLRSDKARDGKLALTLKEIRQFEIGDYVVHVDHGIGQFAGLVRMPGADGAMQEVIKLIFQRDDVVFVSIHGLHKVSKYKGKEGEPPRLSRLGTGAWEKLKERTKSKIKDIARDLIRLYSRRRAEKGFAFSPDTFLQKTLEAGFAYEDTPDQSKVTQEVKSDMESERPMDRLVCGDVGFGKTEIAVRASLKAAVDNKQVAVLVPTTVLALQHFKTFSERLRDFPVQVDYLSRAKSAAQTKQVLADLASGKTDIVIGTHKLIGRNVKFKDLGLLIVDEEQKFGVAVKEKLRQMRTNIDTLTMSATPIPRTLQFSLMGARDFSVIQTPPPNRRPIQTEVHVFSHDVVAEAINFELSRNGQAYIVTHRVSALANLEQMVHKYVPDARICVGHGQMPPAQLEQVVTDFINYEYDVLISTTIIENGIDIPNANTIIIDGAHHFGLSDLHQMRGRVGRSDKKAFCYLLAPPLSLLKDDARRRLEAIENYSGLGSGIHIAMQDLDIRGAGNLLGAEQSGFIADLGYETYQKILTEAVTELKTEEFSDLYEEEISRKGATDGDLFVDECQIECDLRAYFPETYVPGSSERMLLYRELDEIADSTQLEAFRGRMEDRFGPLPPEADELLRITTLRRLGRKAGCERLTLKSGRMVLYFVSRPGSPFFLSDTFGKILRYIMSQGRRCQMFGQRPEERKRATVANVTSVSEACHILENMLQPQQ